MPWVRKQNPVTQINGLSYGLENNLIRNKYYLKNAVRISHGHFTLNILYVLCIWGSTVAFQSDVYNKKLHCTAEIWICLFTSPLLARLLCSKASLYLWDPREDDGFTQEDRAASVCPACCQWSLNLSSHRGQSHIDITPCRRPRNEREAGWICDLTGIRDKPSR